MSYLSLNDATLERAVITLGRYGAWTADVQHVEGSSLEEGAAVTLVFGSQTFVGVVVRSQSNQASALDTRIVGGAGHLSDELTPAQFVSPTARNLLDMALLEAGEALSTDADTDTLASTSFDKWERSSRTLGQELDAIVAAVGADPWRILPAGTVWIGTDAWTASSLTEYEVLLENADQGLLHIAAEDPVVLPGQTLEGIRVGQVIHRIEPDSTRTEIYADGGVDRALGMLDALIRRAAPRDLFAFYEFTVISQSGASLELRSLDSRMPSLSAIPYCPGIPGAVHTVAAGARCLVGFLGGSEQRPYIAAWTSGTPTSLAFPVSSLLHLGALAGADFISLSSLVAAELVKVSASVVNIAAAVNALAPGSVTVIYGVSAPIVSTAATRVKAT